MPKARAAWRCGSLLEPFPRRPKGGEAQDLVAAVRESPSRRTARAHRDGCGSSEPDGEIGQAMTALDWGFSPVRPKGPPNEIQMSFPACLWVVCAVLCPCNFGERFQPYLFGSSLSVSDPDTALSGLPVIR
jgi:hypothetical protein